MSGRGSKASGSGKGSGSGSGSGTGTGRASVSVASGASAAAPIDPAPALVPFGHHGNAFTFLSMTARNTYALTADATNPYRLFINAIVTNSQRISARVEASIQQQLNDANLRVRSNYIASTDLLLFEFKYTGGINIGHFSVHLTPLASGSAQQGAFHVRSNTVPSLLTRYILININGVIQFSRVHINTTTIQPVQGDLQSFETLIVNAMNSLALTGGGGSSTAATVSTPATKPGDWPPLGRGGGGKEEEKTTEVSATVLQKEGDPIFIFASKENTKSKVDLEFHKEKIKKQTVDTFIEPFINVAYILLDEISKVIKKENKKGSKTRKIKSKSKSRSKTRNKEKTH